MATNTPNAQGLSEAKFREQVLIPLLKAMGYNDVDHYHSMWELGKDIVGWKEAEDRTREYVAVVAKIGNVNARATGDAGTVATQVRQAFGSRYRDKITGEERRIHGVIVASTGSIKEPSKKAILTQFEEHLQRHVRFWDGVTVAELVAEYLPKRMVPEKLEEVWQTLRGLQHFTVVPEFRPGGVVHVIGAKGGKVVFAKAKFSFPDTPEDNQARESFQRFIDEGGTVTVSGKHIESFEPHEELARLFGTEKPGTIRLESKESIPRPIRLEVGSSQGPISYEGLGLRLTKSGRLRSEFRTDQENDPVSITIVLNHGSETKQISFTLHFESLGQKARRVRHALRVWEALASGATLTLLDVESNSPFIPKTTLPELESPPSVLLQYVDNLAYIEDRLGWDLTLPEDISDRDVLDAKELRQILEYGSYAIPFGTVSFTFVPKEGIELLSFFTPDETRRLLLEGREKYGLLDRELDLGLAVKTFTVVVSDEEHKHIADQVQQGTDSIEITLDQEPESEGMRTYYPRYLHGEERESFEKIRGNLDDESP